MITQLWLRFRPMILLWACFAVTTLVSQASFAYDGHSTFAAKTAAPEMVNVSRWGRPGLEAGDWVMKGEVSQSTFLRSFKWDPNPSNARVAFKDWATGENFVVPKDTLSWPGGWEKFKGVFGQRIYNP